jgi:hypothetical protein
MKMISAGRTPSQRSLHAGGALVFCMGYLVKMSDFKGKNEKNNT